jgi:hypothetical protein
MNTALRIAPHGTRSPRPSLLATASGLVAAASIVVTLALSGGGGDSVTEPSAASPTASPDRATLYRHGAEMSTASLPIDGKRSAERFHHFR